jgi:GT2 family glycosyltransferase
MTLQLSLVMPCHNRRDALPLTLDALSRQTFPAGGFEVMVVDQASTDGSREFVQGYAAPYPLRLLAQDAKYGISVARNAGIAAAAADRVLLLDADLIADPGLVEAHLSGLNRYPRALLCGRVLPYPPAYATFTEQVADPEAGLDRGEAEEEMPFYQGLGGHMAFLKEIFHRTGLFDPQLKGFEDIEFIYRAGRLGYPLRNNPAAVSYHNHPRSLDERFTQARAYNRMLPLVFERFPELKGAVPLLQDFEPLRLGRDDLGLVLRKLEARLYALPRIQMAARAALFRLDQTRQLPRLARFLFWRLQIANWYIGFHEGQAAQRETLPSLDDVKEIG